MDWMSFVAELVHGLAWPGAILLIVYVLRKQLALLIPALRELEYGTLKLRFGQKIEEIRMRTPDLPSAEATELAAVTPDPTFGPILEVANISPRAAVVEAWRVLETRLRDLAHKGNLERSAVLPVGALLADLSKRDLIPTDFLNMSNDLRELRNEALHAPELELAPEEAREFIVLIAAMILWLEDLQK